MHKLIGVSIERVGADNLEVVFDVRIDGEERQTLKFNCQAQSLIELSDKLRMYASEFAKDDGMSMVSFFAK